MAYITVKDLHADGVSTALPKEYLEKRIALACSVIDTLTQCFFEPQTDYEIDMEGTGHKFLFLPVPPISTSAIDSLTVDGETLDTDYYKVVMPRVPDGRLNPKIKHLTSTWTAGTSIVVTGTFGFVEADGSVPLMIQHACKRIVKWELPKIGDDEAQRADRIIEESLDKYTYKLGQLSTNSGYFGDRKIDNIIAMYRKPAMRTL